MRQRAGLLIASVSSLLVLVIVTDVVATLTRAPETLRLSAIAVCLVVAGIGIAVALTRARS